MNKNDLQFKLFFAAPELVDILRPHLRDGGGAILKNVPLCYLERVQAALRKIPAPSKTYQWSDKVYPQRWNTVFRGPRTHRNTAMTLKRDAHSFDIYTRGV
jgi:hypothetical protein